MYTLMQYYITILIELFVIIIIYKFISYQKLKVMILVREFIYDTLISINICKNY